MKAVSGGYTFLRDNPFVLPIALALMGGALGGGMGGMAGGQGGGGMGMMGGLGGLLLGGLGGWFLQNKLPSFAENYLAGKGVPRETAKQLSMAKDPYRQAFDVDKGIEAAKIRQVQESPVGRALGFAQGLGQSAAEGESQGFASKALGALVPEGIRNRLGDWAANIQQGIEGKVRSEVEARIGPSPFEQEQREEMDLGEGVTDVSEGNIGKSMFDVGRVAAGGGISGK